MTDHIAADQSGVDERLPTPRTDNLILMVSADPADRDNALVDHSRKLERELIEAKWERVPKEWLDMYVTLNHMMARLGYDGFIDTLDTSVASVMTALHAIDGGSVSSRAIELHEMACMPLFDATELSLREHGNPTIASNYPAPQAVDINQLVNRFLSWKLPQSFTPDCGISFKQVCADSWPIGTNLFHAGEARAMFEHCHATPHPSPAPAVAGEAIRNAVDAAYDKAHDACGLLALDMEGVRSKNDYDSEFIRGRKDALEDVAIAIRALKTAAPSQGEE